MTSDAPLDAIEEPVRAPGPAAWLRRHRNKRRPVALGAIASGAALFLIASVTTPLAGADTAHHAAARPAAPDLSGLLPLAEQPSPVVLPRSTPTPSPGKRARAAVPPAVSGLAANGIPTVALNAYRVAAARTDHAEPGCGIDWALLAGIGRVESDHGRFGGAVLRNDGTSSPKIIGPALDGVHFDYIPAPPNGMALDGDARYAHALGPMQFIPQTWAEYGADANGDGVADIFNINDAALGAARYLCAAGGDLRTRSGQERAVAAYNHVAAYVATVLALADAYRSGIPISGIPIGNISGALPPVKHTGPPPAANPGGPTAIENGSKPASTSSSRSASPSRSSSGGTSGTGGSGSGGGSGSPAPAPTPAPTSGSTAPAPAPLPTLPAPTPTSSSPAPAPTPSPTPCSTLDHLLHRC